MAIFRISFEGTVRICHIRSGKGALVLNFAWAAKIARRYILIRQGKIIIIIITIIKENKKERTKIERMKKE